MKDELVFAFLVLILAWSLKHIESSSRLVLIPAAFVCILASPASGPFLLILGYLVPQTVLGGPSIAALPWIILGMMAINYSFDVLRKQKGSRAPVPWAVIICFAAYALIQILASVIATEENIFDRDRWLVLPFFFLCLWQFRNLAGRNGAILALVLSSVALSMRAIIYPFEAVHSAAEAERGMGLADPNYLACWIDLGLIPLFAYLAAGRRDKWYYRSLLPILGILCVCGYALRLGISRGMAIALSVVLVFLLVQVFSKRPFAGAAVFVAIAIMAIPLWKSPVFDGFRTRVESGGSGERLELATMALSQWLDYPLAEKFVGHGSGSTYRLLGMHSHNAYTEVLLDFGVVGLILFFLLLGLAVRSAFRQEGVFRVTAIAWLIFLGVASLSISPFYYLWGWVILALIFPAPKKIRSRETTRPQPVRHEFLPSIPKAA
jgi:O-antigen ligase